MATMIADKKSAVDAIPFPFLPLMTFLGLWEMPIRADKSSNELARITDSGDSNR